MKEDLAALREGLCDDAQKIRCEEQCGSDAQVLAWQCSQCKKKIVSATMPYVWWLLELLMMQDAGAVIALNLLPLEQWADLRLMRRLRDDSESKR